MIDVAPKLVCMSLLTDLSKKHSARARLMSYCVTLCCKTFRNAVRNSNTEQNEQPLIITCNSSKYIKIVIYFKACRYIYMHSYTF